MTLLEGRTLAAELGREAAADAASLAASGVTPTLGVVVPTDDPATDWYLRSITRAAGDTGITLVEARPDPADASSVLAELTALSEDGSVHGIICLTPLPEGLVLAEAGARISQHKDVDGANPASLGRLAAGLPAFAPATAQAVIELLRHSGTELTGASAVVVGRSTVVGKPLALLLLAENATVTVCHTRTRDLEAETRRGAIVVAAAGRAHLIGAAHVSAGAVVVDVGTNEGADGSMVGDVDTEAVESVASLVTPVPGGVGPVTTAVLLRNVVGAARTQA